MTEQVADGLRKRIREEQLGPGDRLGREEDLAREFGVSRPTMREAIRLMSQGGLLRSTKGPGGGTFVQRDAVETLSHSLAERIAAMLDVNAVSVGELISARIALELPVVRLAATRIDDATIETLSEIVVEIEAAPAGADLTGADARFHRSVAAASGNRVLQAMLDWAFEVLQPRCYRALPKEGLATDLVAHHRRILDALAQRDGDTAVAAMSAYLGSLAEATEQKNDAGVALEPAVADPGAARRIALEIQEQIHRSGLEPGARLGREEELAQRLGTSRVVLREALQMLIAGHLVRMSRGPGGGVFVANTLDDGMGLTVSKSVTELLEDNVVTDAELFEARIAVEPSLAALAAVAARPSDLVALKAAIDEQPLSRVDDAVRPTRFHRLLTEAAGSPLVSAITAWMFSVHEPSLERVSGSAADVKLGIEHHKRIYEAIAAGDAEVAHAVMHEHLTYIADAQPDGRNNR